MKRYVIAQELNVQSQVIARWQRIGVLPAFANIRSLQEWQNTLPVFPDGYRGETKAALWRNAIICIPSEYRSALEVFGQSEEMKQKVSAANTGREVTAEHRRKLSESGRGKRKPGQRRIPMRDETKAKISTARKRLHQQKKLQEASMQIVLKNPTDEACQAFEDILTDPHYYSDASEDGNVCYTTSDAYSSKITSWITQAKAQGIIDDVLLLEEA